MNFIDIILLVVCVSYLFVSFKKLNEFQNTYENLLEFLNTHFKDFDFEFWSDKR